MPDITSVLNDQIRRVSRRSIAADTSSIGRVAAQHRRHLAALKRPMAQLQKSVSFLQRQEKRRAGAQADVPSTDAKGIRFRADGLKSHRSRLGLSAGDYGKLVRVSGQAVYNWESKASRPRRQQVARLAAVRGLGKREALQRLEMLAASR